MTRITNSKSILLLFLLSTFTRVAFCRSVDPPDCLIFNTSLRDFSHSDSPFFNATEYTPSYSVLSTEEESGIFSTEDESDLASTEYKSRRYRGFVIGAEVACFESSALRFGRSVSGAGEKTTTVSCNVTSSVEITAHLGYSVENERECAVWDGGGYYADRGDFGVVPVGFGNAVPMRFAFNGSLPEWGVFRKMSGLTSVAASGNETDAFMSVARFAGGSDQANSDGYASEVNDAGGAFESGFIGRSGWDSMGFAPRSTERMIDGLSRAKVGASEVFGLYMRPRADDPFGDGSRVYSSHLGRITVTFAGTDFASVEEAERTIRGLYVKFPIIARVNSSVSAAAVVSMRACYGGSASDPNFVYDYAASSDAAERLKAASESFDDAVCFGTGKSASAGNDTSAKAIKVTLASAVTALKSTDGQPLPKADVLVVTASDDAATGEGAVERNVTIVVTSGACASSTFDASVAIPSPSSSIFAQAIAVVNGTGSSDALKLATVSTSPALKAGGYAVSFYSEGLAGQCIDATVVAGDPFKVSTGTEWLSKNATVTSSTLIPGFIVRLYDSAGNAISSGPYSYTLKITCVNGAAPGTDRVGDYITGDRPCDITLAQQFVFTPDKIGISGISLASPSVGANYTLYINGTGLPGVGSVRFAVNYGSATSISTLPKEITLESANPQVIPAFDVAVTDAALNSLQGIDGSSVRDVTINPNTDLGLSADVVTITPAGVGRITVPAITLTGSPMHGDYTMLTTTPSLASGSIKVTIVPGEVSSLEVVEEVVETNAGSVVNIPIVNVVGFDAAGVRINDTATQGARTIVAELVSFPTPLTSQKTTMTGTTEVAMVDGVAKFDNIVIREASRGNVTLRFVEKNGLAAATKILHTVMLSSGLPVRLDVTATFPGSSGAVGTIPSMWPLVLPDLNVRGIDQFGAGSFEGEAGTRTLTVRTVTVPSGSSTSLYLGTPGTAPTAVMAAGSAVFKGISLDSVYHGDFELVVESNTKDINGTIKFTVVTGPARRLRLELLDANLVVLTSPYIFASEAATKIHAARVTVLDSSFAAAPLPAGGLNVTVSVVEAVEGSLKYKPTLITGLSKTREVPSAGTIVFNDLTLVSPAHGDYKLKMDADAPVAGTEVPFRVSSGPPLLIVSGTNGFTLSSVAITELPTLTIMVTDASSSSVTSSGNVIKLVSPTKEVPIDTGPTVANSTDGGGEVKTETVDVFKLSCKDTAVGDACLTGSTFRGEVTFEGVVLLAPVEGDGEILALSDGLVNGRVTFKVLAGKAASLAVTPASGGSGGVQPPHKASRKVPVGKVVIEAKDAGGNLAGSLSGVVVFANVTKKDAVAQRRVLGINSGKRAASRDAAAGIPHHHEINGVSFSWSARLLRGEEEVIEGNNHHSMDDSGITWGLLAELGIPVDADAGADAGAAGRRRGTLSPSDVLMGWAMNARREGEADPSASPILHYGGHAGADSSIAVSPFSALEDGETAAASSSTEFLSCTGDLTGTKSQTLIGGKAVFEDLELLDPCTGEYAVSFTSQGLVVASVPVVIAVGEPFALNVKTQPPLFTQPEAILNPSPVVDIRDEFFNVIALAGLEVHVRTEQSTARLVNEDARNTVVTTSLGSAIFSALQLTGVRGAFISLRFTAIWSSGALKPAVSDGIKMSDCPVNQIPDPAGGSKCLCVAGHAGETCEPCGIGSYQSQLGEDRCIACSLNMVTTNNKIGATSEASCECRADFFELAMVVPYAQGVNTTQFAAEFIANTTNSAAGNGTSATNNTNPLISGSQRVCLGCPKYAVCFGGGHVEPEAGFWRITNTSLEIKKCHREEACRGGFNSECLEGYKGNLCSACDTAYGKLGTQCTKCPQKGWSYLVFVITVILVAALVAFLSFSAQNLLKRRGAGIQKIFLNYIQITALVGSFHLEFPSSLRSLLSFAQGAGMLSVRIPTVACAFRLSYYDEFVAHLLLPIIGMGGLAIVVLIIFVYRRHYPRILEDGTKEPHTAVRARLVAMSVATFFVIVFLTHPLITKECLQVFSCVSLGDSREWLAVDLSVECKGSQYDATVGLAIVVILAYVLAMPLLMFGVLYYYRFELESPHIKQRIQLLFEGFRMDRYYWELVIVARKIVMVAIVVFFRSLLMQAYAGLALLLVCIMLHMMYKPFTTTKLQTYELISLMSTYTTLTLMLLYQAMASEDEDFEDTPGATVFAVVLVGLNSAVALVFAYEIAKRQRVVLEFTVKVLNKVGMKVELPEVADDSPDVEDDGGLFAMRPISKKASMGDVLKGKSALTALEMYERDTHEHGLSSIDDILGDGSAAAGGSGDLEGRPGFDGVTPTTSTGGVLSEEAMAAHRNAHLGGRFKSGDLAPSTLPSIDGISEDMEVINADGGDNGSGVGDGTDREGDGSDVNIVRKPKRHTTLRKPTVNPTSSAPLFQMEEALHVTEFDHADQGPTVNPVGFRGIARGAIAASRLSHKGEYGGPGISAVATAPQRASHISSDPTNPVGGKFGATTVHNTQSVSANMYGNRMGSTTSRGPPRMVNRSQTILSLGPMDLPQARARALPHNSVSSVQRPQDVQRAVQLAKEIDPQVLREAAALSHRIERSEGNSDASGSEGPPRSAAGGGVPTQNQAGPIRSLPDLKMVSRQPPRHARR